MGSSVFVSRNLHHHHLIKPLFSGHKHAYACASRRYSDYSNNNVVAATSLSERERKEGDIDSGFHFLVQRVCPKGINDTYFSLLSSKNNWAVPVREFRSPDFTVWPDFRGVCDGVLHFSGTNLDRRDYLWVPSANQGKVIPDSKLTCLPGASSMRFQSSGFGFDSESQDYKVVRFASHYFGDPDDYYSEYRMVQAEVYSLKNDSWKEIPQLPIQPGNWFTSAYASGRYYWRYDLAEHHRSIISFDFATEEFSRVNLPPQVEEKWELLGGMHRCMLVEVDGKLGMVIHFRFPGSCKSVLELWVLLKEAVWSRGFVIRNLVNVHSPLLYSSDAGVLFLRADDAELMVYDIHNEELKKLGHYGIFYMAPYINASASAPRI